jgi:hypothetical protein
MRKKTEPAVDVAAVTAAWDAFFQREAGFTKEQLEREGWKDKDMLYALGLSEWNVKSSVKNGKLEKKYFKISLGGMKRDVAFYRPKV